MIGAADMPRVAVAVPSLRRWFAPPLTAFVFLVHPLVALLRPARQLADPGTGWHLATGRWMLEHHAIPHTDPFSFTAAGHPWINYYWIFDGAAALLERIGGLPLYATVCMLVYACVPVLLYRRMVRMGTGILPALLLTFVAHVVLLSHALARPHVVTYLLFAVFLERLDDVYAGRRSARALVPLVPLAVLWCNVHGGFLAGIALAGIYAATAAAEALYEGTPAARGRALALGLACGGIVLATVLNPAGFDLHRDQIHHLAMRTTGAFDEFRSPDFAGGGWPMTAVELLVIGLVVGAARARRRFAPVELVLVLFFLHQALHAVRHVNLFAIVAAPLVARELGAWLSERFPAASRRWSVVASEQAALRSERLYLPALGLLFVALALAGRTGFPTTLDDLQLTSGAAAFISAHEDRFARPFNTDELGGTLIHRFTPAVKVFVDDRIYVYGDDFVANDYLPLLGGRADWRDILGRHAVDSAIVRADAPIATLLREAPEWKLVYEDARNLVFWYAG